MHRERKNLGDKLAYGFVRMSRSIFDFVSGYKHVEKPPAPGMTIEELRKAGYLLSDRQWLEVGLYEFMGVICTDLQLLAHSLFGEHRRCSWNGCCDSPSSDESPTNGEHSQLTICYISHFPSFSQRRDSGWLVKRWSKLQFLKLTHS
jgi:hypothetical protein